MESFAIQFKGGPLDGRIQQMAYPFAPTYDAPIVQGINHFTVSDFDATSTPQIQKVCYELKAVRDPDDGGIIDEYYQFAEAPDWYFKQQLDKGRYAEKSLV